MLSRLIPKPSHFSLLTRISSKFHPCPLPAPKPFYLLHQRPKIPPFYLTFRPWSLGGGEEEKIDDLFKVGDGFGGVEVDEEKRLEQKEKELTAVLKGQVGAIRLGVSRALQNWEHDLCPALKASGFLTRDPLVVERKKPGKAKARKSFQWVKR